MFSNRHLLTVFVATTLLPGLAGCVVEDSNASTTQSQQPLMKTEYETHIPEKVLHTQQWRFQGIVKGAQSYNETIFESAKLVQMKVKEGQWLKQGSLMATLYSPTLAERQKQAQAAYKSAQAQFKLAQTMLKRNQLLLDKALVAKQAFDQSQNQSDTLKQAMEEAKAALSQADNELADTRLYAKTDGVVAKIFLREGEFISPGQAILRFESTAKQRVSFAMPEKLAVSIQNAERHNIKVHATSAIYSAVVIEKSLPTDVDSRLHEVTFELDDNAPQLTGLRVELNYSQPAIVAYKVDYRAIRYDLNNQAYVITVTDELSQTPIKILNMSNNGVVVTADNLASHPVLLGSDATLPVNLNRI